MSMPIGAWIRYVMALDRIRSEERALLVSLLSLIVEQIVVAVFAAPTDKQGRVAGMKHVQRVRQMISKKLIRQEKHELATDRLATQRLDAIVAQMARDPSTRNQVHIVREGDDA
jgi:hypothetical protein